MDELITSYFTRMREEDDLQGDPFYSYSSVNFYTERFVTLPNAVRIEWETYTPEQQAKMLSKMKDLDRHYRLVIAHLRKMDRALIELSWARDDDGLIVPPFLEDFKQLNEKREE